MISIIAAIQKIDRGLGFQNELLYKIPEDLKRFKELTKGHPIIMGRKTFESIGRPLPNRLNIVVTRNADFKQKGVVVADSLEAALKAASTPPQPSPYQGEGANADEIFIIGGGEIYKQALPFTDRLYLTLVDGNKPADTFFPDYSSFTKIIESSDIKTDPETGVSYQYLTLEK
jgi:dihydrofolate reductase